MKRVISFFLVLILLFVVSIPVFADPADYTVIEVDPFTGMPVPGSVVDGTVVESDYLYVNEYCHYDRIQRAFAYEIGNSSGACVYASVAYGMVTTEAVNIEIPTGVTATLYKNGKAVDMADLRHITEPGSYVLSVAGGTSQPIQPLSFTIVSLTTGALDSYRVPDGFYITSVQLDGEEQPYVSNEASMIAEGQYLINYTCEANGLPYNLSVNVDHTPPVLALSNVKDGRASGPVDISDIEDGCTITILRDGKQISYAERLTQSGVYDIYLSDSAGNTNSYNFIILFYFNVTSVLFIVLVVGIVLALIGYLIFTRKHLRVR